MKSKYLILYHYLFSKKVRLGLVAPCIPLTHQRCVGLEPLLLLPDRIFFLLLLFTGLISSLSGLKGLSHQSLTLVKFSMLLPSLTTTAVKTCGKNVMSTGEGMGEASAQMSRISAIQ